MNGAALPVLEELPALPESFGEAAGPDAARRALAENERADVEDAPSATQPEVAPAAVRPQEKPETPKQKPTRATSSPDVASDATKPERRLSVRGVKRLKRVVLEDRYLALRERATTLEAENAELARRAAVVQAVGSDVIAQGVTDMVGELVDLADNGAQLLTEVFGSVTAARIVALEADERARLIRLATPLAKLKLGARIEQSPWLALGVGVVSIALGKIVAVKLLAASGAAAPPTPDAGPAEGDGE